MCVFFCFAPHLGIHSFWFLFSIIILAFHNQMETRASRSNAKRQRTNHNGKHRKSQRVSSPDKPSVHATKIIDLNDDCLMKIFGYLDVQSVFNVAVANEWLRPAAGELYKRKFGRIMVQIEGCEIIRPNTRANARADSANTSFAPKFNANKDCVTVRGLKTCLLYLRCLGPSIRHLAIDYSGWTMSNRKCYDRVHQYMNEYCAESLTTFSFRSMQQDATIDHFQKGFANVKLVRIHGHCLIQLFQSFDKWFPALRDLRLMNIMEYDSVTKPFQHLANLVIKHSNYERIATEKIVADLLNGIHQLKTLVIGHEKYLSMQALDVWLDLIREQSSIWGLFIDTIGCGPINLQQVQRLVQEHSTLVSLQLPNYRFNCDGAAALVRQLKALAEFKFEMVHSEYLQLMLQVTNEWDSEAIAFDCNHTLVTLKRKIGSGSQVQK